jgi:hypothetical protein
LEAFDCGDYDNLIFLVIKYEWISYVPVGNIMLYIMVDGAEAVTLSAEHIYIYTVIRTEKFWKESS